MTKDLTVGSPAGVLWRYSLPLFGSIIFQQLYNIADSLVAGRFIGTAALAAVGNSYEITLLYIAFAFGCNIGTSVVVARLFGAKRTGPMKTAVSTAFLVSGSLGVLLTLSGFFSAGALLRGIKTPADIFADSLEYLQIYIGGFLFLLFYNIATGIFSALGDSRTPFYFLAVSSVTNVAVDILFVARFHMGVAGVAWATFLCQGVSAAAACLVLARRVRAVPCEEAHPLFSAALLKEIAWVAVPSILQQGFISVGNIILQGLINGFGTAAVGGYSAAVKLNNMTITSITALGNGISNYTAQNAGAGKPGRIRQGFAAGVKLACTVAVCFTAAYLLAGRFLLEFFISDGNAGALAAGGSFLRIVAPFYCIIAAKLISDGILRGAKQMGLFMVATLTDLTIRVVCAFLFSAKFGLSGVWMSWPVGWGIAAVVSIALYLHVSRRNFRLTQTAAAPAPGAR